MRKFLGALFSKPSRTVAKEMAGPTRPASANSSDLRSMVFNLSPAEIGVTPETFPYQVWGMVAETGLADGYFTLVVLADGTTSFYLSNGGGFIGAGQKPTVSQASKDFILLGNRFFPLAQPAGSIEPPPEGISNFYFLSYKGTYVCTARDKELLEQQGDLAPLLHAAHVVISEIRKLQP